MYRPHWLIPSSPHVSYATYLKETGENAVFKARGMDPASVLSEVQRSGLRGRGGAGFPTGVKWNTIRAHPCLKRYVVCNAAEGEPGTFKDRFLLRKSPYPTLEGMLIAAYVVDASDLFVAIKGSFQPAIARLRQAIEEMRSVFEGINITVVEGPEEYLFGEEKALLNVIEGSEPLPREAHYPPYELGLFATQESQNPALVNNVETFARVPGIIRHGAASFRGLGTSDTPGTVLFTVSGAVRRPGMYEREAGITLRDLFYEVAGGPRDGRTFKAALSGISSGVVAPDKFGTPADFGSLSLIGSGLGSAGFIVFDDATNIPRVTQALARFLYVESCNQCTACKHGLRTASTAIDELFDERRADDYDFERAVYGARSAPQGNRCYLPVQAAALIPGLMTRFESEFVAQLHSPAVPSKPVIAPKITDFDEETKTFSYDINQAYKNPDWTFSVPPPPEQRPKPAVPAAEPEGAVAVRLDSDVRDGLLRHISENGEDLDQQVNEVLREWLRNKADRDTRVPEH